MIGVECGVYVCWRGMNDGRGVKFKGITRERKGERGQRVTMKGNARE
jgi:hypothetical protein